MFLLQKLYGLKLKKLYFEVITLTCDCKCARLNPNSPNYGHEQRNLHHKSKSSEYDNHLLSDTNTACSATLILFPDL